MLQATSHKSTSPSVACILLAAGRGSRFDPQGEHNKLLQPLADGEAVAIAAAKNLLAVIPDVLAVVRPDAEVLASQLRAVGCKTVVCPDAGQGMAASLVHGLSCTHDARGWLIALADMPYVQTTTIRALVETIDKGAHIAVPTYQGGRGNPVAFASVHLQDLLSLHGDEGARRLLKAFPVTEVATGDPGIHLDIDCMDDLRRAAPA
ncbi:MAG TPA: nucleotidyltransferase family protein [Noviherbaspirillum sp.]|nr:nucleotidyltransferase family protein [Noviherbaspirillum sp.]